MSPPVSETMNYYFPAEVQSRVGRGRLAGWLKAVWAKGLRLVAAEDLANLDQHLEEMLVFEAREAWEAADSRAAQRLDGVIFGITVSLLLIPLCCINTSLL